MTIALYPGSFDPITYGHLDILKKGCEIFDKVIIAISYNSQKQGFLPVDVRKKLIEESVKDFPNVVADCYEGLTVKYAKKVGASVLLRGLRNSSDFEYEKQMLEINSVLNSEIKTVFLISEPQYSCISSSAVREIILNKGDISKFVPKPVVNHFAV